MNGPCFFGIGYPHDAVPRQGTLETERAVSLAAGVKCAACGHEFVGWQLKLASAARNQGRRGMAEADPWAPSRVGPHYHASYYAAFVIGPDGHNIEVVCHEPEA